MTYAPQGGYIIKGIVNNQNVTAHTNDSEVYDWYADDKEAELHEEAVMLCETKLMQSYVSDNNKG